MKLHQSELDLQRTKQQWQEFGTSGISCSFENYYIFPKIEQSTIIEFQYFIISDYLFFQYKFIIFTIQVYKNQLPILTKISNFMYESRKMDEMCNSHSKQGQSKVQLSRSKNKSHEKSRKGLSRVFSAHNFLKPFAKQDQAINKQPIEKENVSNNITIVEDSYEDSKFFKVYPPSIQTGRQNLEFNKVIKFNQINLDAHNLNTMNFSHSKIYENFNNTYGPSIQPKSQYSSIGNEQKINSLRLSNLGPQQLQMKIRDLQDEIIVVEKQKMQLESNNGKYAILNRQLQCRVKQLEMELKIKTQEIYHMKNQRSQNCYEDKYKLQLQDLFNKQKEWQQRHNEQCHTIKKLQQQIQKFQQEENQLSQNRNLLKVIQSLENQLKIKDELIAGIQHQLAEHIRKELKTQNLHKQLVNSLQQRKNIQKKLKQQVQSLTIKLFQIQKSPSRSKANNNEELENELILQKAKYDKILHQLEDQKVANKKRIESRQKEIEELQYLIENYKARLKQLEQYSEQNSSQNSHNSDRLIQELKFISQQSLQLKKMNLQLHNQIVQLQREKTKNFVMIQTLKSQMQRLNEINNNFSQKDDNNNESYNLNRIKLSQLQLQLQLIQKSKKSVQNQNETLVQLLKQTKEHSNHTIQNLKKDLSQIAHYKQYKMKYEAYQAKIKEYDKNIEYLLEKNSQMNSKFQQQLRIKNIQMQEYVKCYEQKLQLVNEQHEKRVYSLKQEILNLQQTKLKLVSQNRQHISTVQMKHSQEIRNIKRYIQSKNVDQVNTLKKQIEKLKHRVEEEQHFSTKKISEIKADQQRQINTMRWKVCQLNNKLEQKNKKIDQLSNIISEIKQQAKRLETQLINKQDKIKHIEESQRIQKIKLIQETNRQIYKQKNEYHYEKLQVKQQQQKDIFDDQINQELTKALEQVKEKLQQAESRQKEHYIQNNHLKDQMQILRSQLTKIKLQLKQKNQQFQKHEQKSLGQTHRTISQFNATKQHTMTEFKTDCPLKYRQKLYTKIQQLLGIQRQAKIANEEEYLLYLIESITVFEKASHEQKYNQLKLNYEQLYVKYEKYKQIAKNHKQKVQRQKLTVKNMYRFNEEILQNCQQIIHRDQCQK